MTQTELQPSGNAPMSPAPLPTPASNWSRRLQQLGPVIGLVFVFALFSALRPHRFPVPRNLQLMLQQTAVVATAALGMTLIIISGGIDLSVGSTIAMTTMVIAQLLTHHTPPLIAALGGVATGAVCGALIGILVTQLRLAPFIATLGTWAAYRGIAKAIGHDTSINAPETWLNELLSSGSAEHNIFLVPTGVWLSVVLALLVAGMLRYTRFGRHIFAIGSNEQTARLCGINVKRTKLLIYTVAIALVGVAGVLQFGFLGQGDPTTANGMELDIIAAVVIGGASLSGGQGTILGTIIGALIMTVVSNGCTKLDIPESYQQLITGSVIIAAAALDQFQHRREE
jgi:ribose transport system permease protein